MAKSGTIQPQITLIGAGLAGCFLAYLLGKKGYTVTVFESRSDYRSGTTDHGKSFNLTLYYRGIKAIKKAGLWNDLKKIITPVKGNVCHLSSTTERYDPYEITDKQVLYTVHRSALNVTLLKKADRLKNVKFYFDTRVTGIDKGSKTLHLTNTKTEKATTHKSGLIIGTDGVNSVARTVIQQNQTSTHTQEFSDWGYKEVRVSARLARKMKLEYHATHTWPRKNTLLIAFPNPDKSFTLMFNLPLEGVGSFAALFTDERIEQYITKQFPELLPLLPEIKTAFLSRPTGYFVSIYTKPWYYKDFLMILGDAAHGVYPFYGQGMCAAFEDCHVFISLISKYNGDFIRILPAFQQARKIHTDVLADLSKENFVRLRDDATSSFRTAHEKLRSGLHRLFPSIIKPPLYKLIAHDTMPYADAYNGYRRQHKLFRFIGADIAALVLAGVLYTKRKLKKS